MSNSRQVELPSCTCALCPHAPLQAADADADPRCALPCGGPVAFAPSYRPRASRVAAADPSFASNGSGSGSDWGSSSNGNGNGSGHSLGGSMESVGGAAPSSSHSTSLASTASTDEGAAAKVCTWGDGHGCAVQ